MSSQGIEGASAMELAARNLQSAVNKFLGDTEKREKDLIRREQELAHKERAFDKREESMERKEKSFSDRERVMEREKRKYEHLQNVYKKLEDTASLVEMGKVQILEDKKKHRQQLDKAIERIKAEAEKEREDVFNALIQEVEALTLPSANFSFKNETATVESLVSKVKNTGDEIRTICKSNKIYLTSEGFNHRFRE